MQNRDTRRSGEYGYTAQALGISSPGFSLLRDLVAERTGVFFDDAKADLLADKLSGLVAELGMTSLMDYYYVLKYDTDADRHWADVLDRLAVPETYFWRQPEHFDVLTRVIVPRFFAQHPGRTLRIWSAACCSGEEPISIAIALAEAGWLGTHSIEIVASDASQAMIRRARRGLYGERAFRALPQHLRDRYFRLEDAGWRARACVHKPVQWTTANLMNAAEVTTLAKSDVIFCRNVFIYFSDDAIRQTARLFSEHMPRGGYLFLGASESLSRFGSDFNLVELGGAFVYGNGTDAPAPVRPNLEIERPTPWRPDSPGAPRSASRPPSVP